MDIKEITDKEVWENFLLNCQEKTFLDSWNWGEFQKKQEDKIWRFGIYDNGQLIGVALVIKVKAKRGTFIFVPHGPNISNPRISKQEILRVLMEKLKEIGKKERAAFVRIAPIIERTDENSKTFKDLGFKEAPIHIHPEVTWELDLFPSEENILSQMRKTHRYLIKQAEKNSDIQVVKSDNLNDLEVFHKILTETSKRHKFIPFSLNYLVEQFSCFRPDNQITIWLGKYKEEVISSAITVYWQKTGFYHHGASLQKYNSNKVPVAYLIQWEAIKEAKKRGCLKYNFWGIAPGPNHPWAGLSQFKMGFSGYQKEYTKTQDLPISSLYYLTSSFERLRKIKRGL